MLKRLLHLLLVGAMLHQLPQVSTCQISRDQSAQQDKNNLAESNSAMRTQVQALKLGTNVTIRTSSQKKVAGKLTEKTPNAITIQTDRGFFRHGTVVCPIAEIVSIKKNLPSWVAPMIVAGIVGGVVIGVVGWVSSSI